jgi:hypothetical protein
MRLVALAAVLSTGCPASGYVRDYPEPSVKDVVAKLATARDALSSFKADSMMDYRLNNQRAKVEVLLMGTIGAKLRINALSPAGGAPLADMACDGTNFTLVDDQNNCALSGPCDSQSIARFFHLELAPDDFVHLALGTVPLIANTGGSVKWDADKGYERVELTSPGGTQKVVIDARDHHWDVITSELVGSDGKVVWSVENKDFQDIKGHRVPGKTWFKSPVEGNDVIVEWTKRDVDVVIDPAKFILQPPAGLRICH